MANLNNTSEEIWKDIAGYEGRYQISNLGRVKSLVRSDSHGKGIVTLKIPRIRRPHINTSGYYHIRLMKNNVGESISIHRLVAIAFIPNPLNLPEVNHLNGKLNNTPKDIEWCTTSNNLIHAYKTGLRRKLKLEENPKAKLNRIQVLEIFNSKGITLHALAAMYNVSSMAIQCIRYGKSWSEITGKVWKKKSV